jgi:hypothetical protein
MANVNISLGYKNNTWFTANSTLVLLEGQIVFLEQTGTYKLGDGVTQLSALSFLGGSKTLEQTLANGNITGTNNIVVTSGTVIKSDSNNNEINIDVNFEINSDDNISLNTTSDIHLNAQNTFINGQLNMPNEIGSKIAVFDASKNVKSGSYFEGDIELTSNKQNSLAIDGTGFKYPTVDAVNNLKFASTVFGYLTGTTLSSNTSYYFGGLYNLAWQSGGASPFTKNISPITGFLKNVIINFFVSGVGVGGTGALIRVLNITSGAQVTLATAQPLISQNSFVFDTNLAVNKSDLIQLIITTQTYTTAPTACVLTGTYNFSN